MYCTQSLRITVLQANAPVATAMRLLLSWLLLPWLLLLWLLLPRIMLLCGCSRGRFSCGCCSRGSCSLAAAPVVAAPEVAIQYTPSGAAMFLDAVTIPSYDRATQSGLVPLPRISYDGERCRH
jgi:hypothetical protein